MNCDDVIPLLSPFHDGELAPDQLRAVAEHIAACASCSEQLESIRRLADLVDSTPAPEAPRSLLAKVERSLDSQNVAACRPRRGLRPRSVVSILLAGAAAVVVGLIVWRTAHGPNHSHHEMVRAFGEFLDAYERGESDAQDALARKYQGTLVTDAAATTALKRPTVARATILAGHQATKRYVLKMPCCDCVQTIYARNGETSIVLFEHDKEQAEWFDERPMIQAACRGRACCLVQLEAGLAATWPVAGGFVTVVGVRDVSELGNLVDELSAR